MGNLISALKERLPGIESSAVVADTFTPASLRSVQVALEVARDKGMRLKIDLGELNAWIGFDERSLIAHVQGGATLAEVEQRLAARDATLGLRLPTLDAQVGTWIAQGMKGSPDKNDDPVSQTLAGLEVVLNDGRLVTIRPAPRRAVGPDLIGALVGGSGLLGIVVGAHLVARPRIDSKRLAFAFDTPAEAESARAWIRGKGVRPLRTWVLSEGEKTRLVLEVRSDSTELGQVQADVAVKVAIQYGGQHLQDVHTTDSHTTLLESPTIAKLADELAR